MPDPIEATPFTSPLDGTPTAANIPAAQTAVVDPTTGSVSLFKPAPTKADPNQTGSGQTLVDATDEILPIVSTVLDDSKIDLPADSKTASVGGNVGVEMVCGGMVDNDAALEVALDRPCYGRRDVHSFHSKE